jgi:EAL and modified HD-GYP domain-containing signal transduction protein
MSQFMVGRQPIFDAKLDVRGYELLFRDPSFPVLNGDAMTADVLVHAGLDVGLRSLVGDKLAFVNATRAFLVGEQEFPFPARTDRDRSARRRATGTRSGRRVPPAG